MSIFKRDFNKPGPGIEKDEPHKKGVRRFIEILICDFWNLFKLNILMLVFIAPAQVVFSIVFQNLPNADNPLFWITVALLLGLAVPVGAAMTAGSYILSKMMRNDPGYVWHDFKNSFKSGFRQSLLAGMLYILLSGTYMQLLFVYEIRASSGMLQLCIFLAILVFHMVYPLFFLQAGYLTLNAGTLRKNSLLIAFGHAPRQIVSALVLIACRYFSAAFFPASIIPMFFFGYSLPMLVSMMLIWPITDGIFNIESALQQKY